jgi:membrane-associated protease RseP (regulator of RpoE activity)
MSDHLSPSPPHASKRANNKAGNMTVKVITGVRDEVNSKYGISFCRKTPESPIIIKEVRKDGIFARQGLVPGMVVKAVNGEKVQWKRPTEAATLLAQTDFGNEVSVAVEAFTGIVHRTHKSQKWGLTLKNSTKMSGIFISGIEDDALFASTELKPGMKVIRINGKRCPREAKHVISMVAKTGDDLVIVAVYADPRAKAEKENEAEKNEVTDETALNRMFPSLALL